MKLVGPKGVLGNKASTSAANYINFPSLVIHLLSIVIWIIRFAFQTPEAWSPSGEYRSMCYMRPLAIWAMQWALSSQKQIKPFNHHQAGGEGGSQPNWEHLNPHHGFRRIAELLKLSKQEPPKSFIQSLHEFLCRKL